MKNSIYKGIIFTLSIAAFLLFLYVIYWLTGNDILFPAPHEGIKSFFSLLGRSNTYLIIFSSLLRLLVALCVSFLVGGILGIIAARFYSVELFLKPWITIFRSVPLASIIVIIMVLLGLNNSVYVIVMLMLVPVSYEAFLKGIKSLDKFQMMALRLDGGFSFKNLFRVILPLALPFIEVAFVTSAGMGIKVLVMAEFICSTNNSIGRAIKSASDTLQYNYVFAWTLIALLFDLIIEGIPTLIYSKKKK